MRRRGDSDFHSPPGTIGVAVAAALWSSCLAAAPPGEIEIGPALITLRDSGYLLGDLIDERVDLALPAASSLDPDSLPLPGRVAPWMEVRAARIESGRGQGATSVRVTYQIFAEVEQAARVPIPAFKLRVRDGAKTHVVEVPAKSFLLSPALPPTLTDEDRELKPSPDPHAIPAMRALVATVSSLLAAAMCATYLLWVHDRLPFLRRASGPFARLWRSSRRRREFSPEDSIALLHAWHAALNLAAGETLYPSTLVRLFSRAPYLAPLRANIEDLFGRSWQSFYGPPGAPAPAPAEILDVLRAAAGRERGVPC